MTVRPLIYADGEAVEVGDIVDVRLPHGIDPFDGRVLRSHPLRAEVGVRVEDYTDHTKQGTPRMKTFRVPIADVDLVRRDS